MRGCVSLESGIFVAEVLADLKINFQTKTKNQFLCEQKNGFSSSQQTVYPTMPYLDVFFAEKLGFVLFPLDDFAPAVKT